MASTGKMNGDVFLVYTGPDGTTYGTVDAGDAIAHSIDATLSVSQELPDATTKDSNKWVEHITGNKSWEISGSGLVALDSSFNAEYLLDSLMNGTTLAVHFSSNVTGDVSWYGDISVSASSINAPQNSAVGYDFTFVGNGPLTKVTLT